MRNEYQQQRVSQPVHMTGYFEIVDLKDVRVMGAPVKRIVQTPRSERHKTVKLPPILA